MMTPQRVLVFGDSLAVGFSDGGRALFPYSTQLQAVLNVPVEATGCSGWRTDELRAQMRNPACRDLTGRVSPGLIAKLQSREDYTLCILQAGSNDLLLEALGKPPRALEDILDDLKALHLACHARGIRTMAIGVMGCKWISPAKLQLFNGMLAAWAASASDWTTYADMPQLLPYSESGIRVDWEPDALHLTPAGYSRFGYILAPYVRRCLETKRAAMASSMVFSMPCRGLPPVIQSLKKRDLFFTSHYVTIRVAWRFKTVLCPLRLCRALNRAFITYPSFSGYLVMGGGEGSREEPYIAGGQVNLTLRVGIVHPDVLSDRESWDQINDEFPLSHESGNSTDKLFSAFLLRSLDPADGSVLVCTFHHVLGDATALGIFMSAWAAFLQTERDGLSMSLSGLGPHLRSAARLTPEPKPGGTHYRLYQLDQAWLEGMKARGPPGVSLSSNDILMALCVSALAPCRTPDREGKLAMSLQIDPRGRGIPTDYMGNAACTIYLRISSEVALHGDILTIATHLKSSLAEQVAKLSQDPWMQQPIGWGNPTTSPELFHWNSWVRSSLQSVFDPVTTVLDFSWLNLLQCGMAGVIVAVPVREPSGAVGLAVSLAEMEMQALHNLLAEFERPLEGR
eukprot:RCo015556